jgi:hypothetical protein
VTEAEQEEELDEGALLGEATIAKLNVTRKVDETPAEEAPKPAEESKAE